MPCDTRGKDTWQVSEAKWHATLMHGRIVVDKLAWVTHFKVV